MVQEVVEVSINVLDTEWMSTPLFPTCCGFYTRFAMLLFLYSSNVLLILERCLKCWLYVEGFGFPW